MQCEGKLLKNMMGRRCKRGDDEAGLRCAARREGERATKVIMSKGEMSLGKEKYEYVEESELKVQR